MFGSTLEEGKKKAAQTFFLSRQIEAQGEGILYSSVQSKEIQKHNHQDCLMVPLDLTKMLAVMVSS